MLPKPNSDLAQPADAVPDTGLEQTLSLADCETLSADAVAAHMASGELVVTVDGAMSEWGSRVDDLVHKLEHSVLKWRKDGATKTLTLHFIESALEPAKVEPPAAPDEDVLTFKAD